MAGEIIAGMREALEHAEGRLAATTHRPPMSDVTAARLAMGMTQAEFATMLSVPLPTVRKWERGATRPSGAAVALMRIIKARPEVVRDALASTAAA